MAIIAAIAVVIALPSVVALARLFRSQLYGVTTFDPIALGERIAADRGHGHPGRGLARAPRRLYRTHASAAH